MEKRPLHAVSHLDEREVSRVYYDSDIICRGAYHRDDFNSLSIPS